MQHLSHIAMRYDEPFLVAYELIGLLRSCPKSNCDFILPFVPFGILPLLFHFEDSAYPYSVNM